MDPVTGPTESRAAPRHAPLKRVLRALHLASLLAAAFWAVVWPLASGFDTGGDAAHVGMMATLATWVGSMTALCALRVRESRER
jgi:hypothetical protein